MRSAGSGTSRRRDRALKRWPARMVDGCVRLQIAGQIANVALRRNCVHPVAIVWVALSNVTVAAVIRIFSPVFMFWCVLASFRSVGWL